jgi:hypothetical protein
VGGWEYLSQAEAETHVQAGGSLFLQGRGGVGKSYWICEQLAHMTGYRVLLCAKMHVACHGLRGPGEVMTLARLYRRYVQQGALGAKTLLVVDELSLCTTVDFHQIINPLARLGCTRWLLGDCRNQLLSIGDTWHGAALSRDLTDTVMLRAAVGCKTLLMTERRRADPPLFRWLSALAPGGAHSTLPLALWAARRDFPPRGRPSLCWNLVPLSPHPAELW